MYHSLGISPRDSLPASSGEPLAILDDAKPIIEFFA